jgi:hypothetical protein
VERRRLQHAERLSGGLTGRRYSSTTTTARR